MPDENIEQTEETQITSPDKVVETTEELEETPLTHQEQEVQKDEEKQGIIESIKERLWGNKEEETEETSEPSKEFLEAAKQASFTSAQIEQLAKDYTPEQLDEMIPHLVEEEEEEEEEETEEEKETVKEHPVPENLKEELKPFYEEIRKEFENRDRERVEALEELKGRLVDLDADKVVETIQQENTNADKFFDKVAKDFPVFGATKELPRFPEGHKNAGDIVPVGDAFKARNEVYGMARKLQQLGSDWESSLEDAFAWYKGKHGEKEISKKIVKDLKKNEQRLSARRTSKNTTKTYANEYEEKMALIEEAKRKAGIG